MSELKPPDKCSECGKPMTERKGAKDGKPYHFWGCSGYPECKNTWRPPGQGQQNHEEMMKALRAIWKELEDHRKEFQKFAEGQGK